MATVAIRLTVEVDREADGRWLAEVVQIPGCLVYGSTCSEAASRRLALAGRVLRGT